jgi:hypothetical protein
MGYRPLADMWFLARARLKPNADGSRNTYYGAYPGGFPERARALLGATIGEPVLHVCGGMARHYPYAAGFGALDETLDLDPVTQPDFLQDARDPLPTCGKLALPFKAMLIDPPYSELDAEEYGPGRKAYPKPNVLVKNAMAALQPGQRVGIIHYVLPRCPKGGRFIACAGVIVGFDNRIRCYSVFEKGGL